MGLFDRLRSAGQVVTDSNGKVDTSELDATRLIDEGHALEAEGRLDEAMQRYLDAIRLAPNPARAHLNHGNVLLLKGDLQGALNAFSTAIKHKPDYAGAYYNIGNALLGNRQFDEAVTNYRRALEIQPDYAEVHCSLGVALKELGKLDDAVACFQRALKINPDLLEAHRNLDIVMRDIFSMGNVLMVNGQLDAAVANYRRVLEIKPDYAEAHITLGAALKDLGQLDGAVTSYRRGLEIKPDLAEAHNNLGVALQDLGQSEDAVASYRRALEIKPDFPEANFNLSLLLLSLGQYAEAWPKYEARYHSNFKGIIAIPPDVSFPQWQGEPLTGKSLLIWPEQGFGDEIQFARYIHLLNIRGVSRITLVCKPPLKALLETLEGVDAVVTPSEAACLPFHDFWAFSMSLALHLATTVETIPTKLPYLSAPLDRLNKWRCRLPMDGLKVGLVWKGSALNKNDANRSLPSLSILEPLWSVPGVTFLSLQKGQGEEEAATPPVGQPILHLGSDIADFADTAAIVSQLDLVICIDTAIAHLTGALCKPCWVLLPAVGIDWRWLREHTDSLWYPGVMRLFRQTKAGDWASPINEATQALRTWVDEHRNTI
jgi:tetratricopeptide (TPR) repeat protein